MGGENLEGIESPLNVITPDFVGQVFVQSDGTIWQAGSLLSSSWTVICDGANDVGLMWGPAPETVDSMDVSNANTNINTNWFGGTTSYTELSFGNPVTVTNTVELTSNTTVTSLTFRNLTAAGDATFVSNTALAELSLPELASVGNDFLVTGSSVLTVLFAPSLTTVTGNVLVGINILLPAISFPSLATIGGNADFSSNDVLVSASFAVLTTIGGNLDFSFNPALTSFSAPNWLPTDGTAINFTGGSLTDTSVNHILARCVAAGLTTATIDLSGGTNAAPTGQGIVDAADLTTAGCTVTTN